MNFIAALRKVTESIKAWVEARVTSWNDLTDKPFGEKSVVLEWDGDTTDKVVVTVPVGGLYKVYDTVVSLEGLTVNEVITSGGQSVSASVSTLGNGSFGVVSGEMPFIIVAAEDNFETMGQVFPEKGVYFLVANGMFLARCELNDIVPIDEKYLPESVKGGGGIFYVDIEYSEDNWDNISSSYMDCSATKTFAEILAAYLKGATIICRVPFVDESET